MSLRVVQDTITTTSWTAGGGRIVRRIGTAVIYLGVVIAAWAIYVRAADVPIYLLPSPEQVWTALSDLATSGMLWPNLLYTVRNIIIGLLSGILIGSALGWLLHSSQWVRMISAPYIVTLQAAPKIALAPLLVLWFGLGLSSQMALIIMLAFFPMMIAMMLGLNSISDDVTTLGRLLNLTRWQFFTVVQLPGATPALFAGAKIAVIDAMTGAFLAEYISAQKGLGYLMVLGNTSYDTPMLIAAVLLTVIVGLSGFGLVSLLESRLLSWRR